MGCLCVSCDRRWNGFVSAYSLQTRTARSGCATQAASLRAAGRTILGAIIRVPGARM
jgi:hypothetical protein